MEEAVNESKLPDNILKLQQTFLSLHSVLKKAAILKTIQEMKKDIHPKDYRLVAFRDMSNGFTFVTKSTASSKETVKLEDGVEYPLIKLEISSTSHPFYTGKMKLVDTAGRVDKFMNRYKTHLDKKKK
jgi:large subunit ribosomal protein L31